MKIALCLSGGGLRAAAHIGVLRFLEEEGVEITAVSGSSAGALVGLFLAEGKTSAEIYDFLHQLRKRELFTLSSEPGLFSLEKLEKKLRKALSIRSYKECRIPLYTCVTELNTGATRYIAEGDPMPYTIASSSLTPLFVPKRVDGILYTDGGLSDNLPVSPLRKGEEKVLSVNINPLTGHDPKNFKSLLIRTLLIMMHATIKPGMALSDAYLEIGAVARMGLFDFDEIDPAYEAGYRAIKEHWEELKQKLV